MNLKNMQKTMIWDPFFSVNTHMQWETARAILQITCKYSENIQSLSADAFGNGLTIRWKIRTEHAFTAVISAKKPMTEISAATDWFLRTEV